MQVDLLAGNEVQFVRSLITGLSARGVYNAHDVVNSLTPALIPPIAPPEPSPEVLSLRAQVAQLTEDVESLRETVRRSNPNYGKF